MMAFRTKPTGVAALDSLCDLLQRVFDSFTSVAVTNEHLSRVTLVPFIEQKVFHGLGSPPVTWEVVRKSADANVYESTPSASAKDYLNFTSATAVTVTIRFC